MQRTQIWCFTKQNPPSARGGYQILGGLQGNDLKRHTTVSSAQEMSGYSTREANVTDFFKKPLGKQLKSYCRRDPSVNHLEEENMAF